jgi:hypothetical protein
MIGHYFPDRGRPLPDRLTARKEPARLWSGPLNQGALAVENLS